MRQRPLFWHHIIEKRSEAAFFCLGLLKKGISNMTCFQWVMRLMPSSRPNEPGARGCQGREKPCAACQVGSGFDGMLYMRGKPKPVVRCNWGPPSRRQDPARRLCAQSALSMSARWVGACCRRWRESAFQLTGDLLPACVASRVILTQRPCAIYGLSTTNSGYAISRILYP